MTEFEKLQAIIADVLNVSPETITPDTLPGSAHLNRTS